MRRRNSLRHLLRAGSYLLAIVGVLCVFPSIVTAQAPPVPTSYQDLYTELDNYLINFNATLPPALSPPYPALMSAP